MTQAISSLIMVIKAIKWWRLVRRLRYAMPARLDTIGSSH